MKKCSLCKRIKSQDEFSVNGKTEDGLHARCKSCVTARQRYYQQNKQKIKARSRQYYHDNSARAKQTQKKYRQENAEALKKKKSAWQKKHYQENKKQYREKGRALLRRKPEIMVAKKARRKSRIAGNGGSFTAQEWIDLKERYGHTCLRCGKQEPQIKLSVDHVVSLVHGGSSDISNIQPLCCSCNKSKQGRSQDFRHFPVCQLGMMA